MVEAISEDTEYVYVNPSGSPDELFVRGRVAVLLGAGASVDAGIPSSYKMTEEILERLPRGFGNTRWALNFVCAAMLAHLTARGGELHEGLDVEKVFAAVELLAERHAHEAAPFVLSWHPAVDQIDLPPKPVFFQNDLQRIFDGHRNAITRGLRINGNSIIASAGGHDNSGRALGQALETFVKAHSGVGNGAVYRQLKEQMISALNDLLHISSPSKVAYLAPILNVLNHQERVLVGTLNYDRSVEILCGDKTVPCATGIDQWSRERSFTAPSTGVQLLKLHGSIDWAKSSPHPALGMLRKEEISLVEGGAHNPDPAIVFGQREKLRAVGPFLDLLSAWEKGLESADSLIVVGYSFRDSHINETIRRWSNSDVSHRLFVVDPFWGDPGPEGGFRSELSDGLAPRYPIQPGVPLPPPRFRVVTAPAGAGLDTLLSAPGHRAKSR